MECAVFCSVWFDNVSFIQLTVCHKKIKQLLLLNHYKACFFNYSLMNDLRSKNHYHHRVLLLLVEHRASTKSFQALRSPTISLTSFHDLPMILISSSIVLRHVVCGLPLLLYPRGFQSNTAFSIAPAFYVTGVQSNSIFLFLCEFLLTSVW
jgi:hypothetical protein